MSMSGKCVEQKMGSEYWDTCLFIAYLKNSHDEQPAVEAIDALIRSAQPPVSARLIVVSTMVLAELQYRTFTTKFATVLSETSSIPTVHTCALSLSPHGLLI